MSDISIEFEWWELLLASPVFGWPGALAGAAIGFLLARRRRLAGAVLGAIIGNLAMFAAVILTR